jgi:hypothetical protein
MSVVDARMCSTLFVTATLVSVLTVGPAFAEGPLPDSSGYQYSQPIEPTFSDISYATLSSSEKFDLYLPAARDRPAPLVIWIHGGAFRVGDKRSMPRRNFGPPPKPVGPMGPSTIQLLVTSTSPAQFKPPSSGTGYRVGLVTPGNQNFPLHFGGQNHPTDFDRPR